MITIRQLTEIPLVLFRSLSSVVILVCLAHSNHICAQESTPAESPSASTDSPAEADVTGADDKSPEEAEDDSAEAESGKSKIEVKIPIPWQMQPYRIRVIVSFGISPVLPASRHPQLLEDLQLHLQSQFHQLWNLEVQRGSGSTWLSLDTLAAMSEESLPEEFKDPEIDKVFLVAINHEIGHFSVLVREWDTKSETLGSSHLTSLIDRREIVALMAQQIAEAFRPLAELELVNDRKIEFQIRGGEFLPRNPEMQQFFVGDYLVPFMRYLNRQREVQKITHIPWSYLKVEDITRSRMLVTMNSAFGNPIGGSRRRVEILAMRIRPFLDETEILVYPKGRKENPLVGYRCEVMDRVPTADDAVEDRLKLETDRRGVVTVPVNVDSPLQYLYVYSGQALLAKVPFVPGAARRLEVEVPDDTPRLTVEGEVALLQSELIDIIATREVLIKRGEVAARAKRWDDVNRFVEQTQDLPTQQEFLGRIDSLEVRGVQLAKSKRDRIAEIRIKRLCSSISRSAKQHLDPFRIAEFRRDMNEARQNSR